MNTVKKVTKEEIKKKIGSLLEKGEDIRKLVADDVPDYVDDDIAETQKFFDKLISDEEDLRQIFSDDKAEREEYFRKRKEDSHKPVADDMNNREFGIEYQAWYPRAKKIVEELGQDRLEEFSRHYSIDPKRKKPINADNYVIQDYVEAPEAPKDRDGKVLFDHNHVVQMHIRKQMQILASLDSRIDSVL